MEEAPVSLGPPGEGPLLASCACLPAGLGIGPAQACAAAAGGAGSPGMRSPPLFGRPTRMPARDSDDEPEPEPAPPPQHGRKHGGRVNSRADPPELRLWKEHERRWAEFEGAARRDISYKVWQALPARCRLLSNDTRTLLPIQDIPWPPGLAKLLRWTAQARGLDPGTQQGLKEAYKVLSLRWHSDKFLAKYGGRLIAADRERILARVLEVSQEVNAQRRQG